MARLKGPFLVLSTVMDALRVGGGGGGGGGGGLVPDMLPPPHAVKIPNMRTMRPSARVFIISIL